MAVDQLYIDEDYIEDGHFQTGVEIVWGERRVLVPVLALTLVQSTPTTIYNLDLNEFRMALKALEASEVGAPYPDTHRHNTIVTLGGVTFARLIEVINDYVVEFEDGNYAVNLVGANSNVADRVVVNQVSVRSANSAGLVQIAGGSSDPVTIAEQVRLNLALELSRLDIAVSTRATPADVIALS